MTDLERSAYFFGNDARPLFGVRHFATGDTVRDTGILLCYPAPQEYRVAHWIFQKLAVTLASHGFPVLRFDYFATGDSAGDASEGSLQQWVEDIETAASELKDSAGVRRVSLVGMRLGAALAFRAVAQGLTVRDLILWDPVLKGPEYMTEIEHAEMVTLHRSPYPVEAYRVDGELMGYPFSASMRQQVMEINLLTEPMGKPRRMHIISPTENAAHSAFLAAATDAGVAATGAVVNDPVLYPANAYPLDTLLAHHGSQAIVEFLDTRRQ